jgi:hypothetical protein
MAAWLRDMTFIPMARLPFSRGQMLRVLTGTQKGWFGRLSLPSEFLDALGAGLGNSTIAPPTSPARRFPLSVDTP